MNEPWYETVSPDTRLTQGDLIFDCPILTWSGVLTQYSGSHDEIFKNMRSIIAADVVVMTQACDLEHDHVQNLVLCPHLSLSGHKTLWEEGKKAKGDNPTVKAWRNHCQDIKDGYLWNLAMLNSAMEEAMEIRVVDFREIFTLPRDFLESLIGQRGLARLRLRPPYREHLSQAFARYFMRVGLPTSVNPDWK